MIDLVLLRNDFERIKTLLLKKEPSFNVDKLRDLDVQVRALKTSTEELRKQKNELAKKAAHGFSEELRAQSKKIGERLKEEEAELKEKEEILTTLWASCPNVPLDDIPDGGKESNVAVKVVNTKPNFDFTPKNHVELNEKNKWFNFEAATAMSGSHFIFYNEPAAQVLYALTQLMLVTNQKHGFSMCIPPYLVHERSLFNASNFPKFKDQVYTVQDDGLYLIPTAEVSLTNLYADTIFLGEELPKRHCAWTSCFRREAGGYGAQERGLIRIHQFEKVELYTICKQENSATEQQKMLECSQEILNLLGLHYRISLLAAQDCSFASMKTYDVEVWLPGQNSYYEVSSVSNCGDFQARRTSIRYRNYAEEKPQLVHTLNASSLALPRLMVALMETYQQEDGSIKLPSALEKYIRLWQP